MGHGWEGAVLRLLRGRDFTFTVTDTEQVTEHYRRIRLTDGGMLAATGAHPAMWVRIWFEHRGRPHQRAYTLVDPDPGAGTFALEFALHDGAASAWARTAEPGDRIEATVQGSGFDAPDPAPDRLVLVGDPASLPALNSLLTAYPRVPGTVFFETSRPTDGDLPFRLTPGVHELRTVPRAGKGLVPAVREALPQLLAQAADPYVWGACDTVTTRALDTLLRRELAVPRPRRHTQGYWRPA